MNTIVIQGHVSDEDMFTMMENEMNPSQFHTAPYLREAQEIIRDPENWCKGALAKDMEGNEVELYSRSAAQFCAKGALLLACGGDADGLPSLEHYMLKAKPFGQALHYVGINELRGHEAVMKVFDEAILLAEADDLKYGGTPTPQQLLESRLILPSEPKISIT